MASRREGAAVECFWSATGECVGLVVSRLESWWCRVGGASRRDQVLRRVAIAEVFWSSVLLLFTSRQVCCRVAMGLRVATGPSVASRLLKQSGFLCFVFLHVQS
ncbi:hypothetical protein L2E82_06221 [Cichorium intybus]|uniref:Uncharacterized protein n=1 Tax=Cichorium intybus TaxID=13427 RepID=A0ACB9H9A1_CICIN|nr:hypothetical protein L2E82_06221 [Cichorium intybus]